METVFLVWQVEIYLSLPTLFCTMILHFNSVLKFKFEIKLFARSNCAMWKGFLILAY